MSKLTNGQKVKVKLCGDEDWYDGIVEGKERKYQIRLTNHSFLDVADYTNTVDYKVL